MTRPHTHKKNWIKGNRNCCGQQFGSSQMKEQKHKRSSILSLDFSSPWLPREEAQCCPRPTITSCHQTWIFQSFIGPQASSPASTHNVKLCLISSAQNQLALLWPGNGGATAKPSLCAVEKSLFHAVTVKMVSQACDLCYAVLMMTKLLNTTSNVFEIIQRHNVY